MESTALPIVPQVSDDLLELYALQILKLQEEDSPIQKILHEIEKVAADEKVAIIGALEGKILTGLIKTKYPRPLKVLDIGTAIGYSAIWLARVIGKGGHITSIEIDPIRAEIAREYVKRAGVQEQVTIITGDVFELVNHAKELTNEVFDVIFQDVMKHVYFAKDPGLALQLLEISIKHLAGGGYLFTDNAFCQGKVMEKSEYNQVKGIQAYNEAIARHPELDSLLFPFRDGLWFSKRIEAVN
ncbi:MAG: O-methyltransferase [Chloroflexota bacterium]